MKTKNAINCSISFNQNEEMMSIKDQNNKVVFYGNYSDFSREPQSLAKTLKSLGLNVEIDNKLESVG